MAMDFLRAPYRTKMRFFREPNLSIEVPVRWFFCGPDAQAFPEWHRFASGNYSDPQIRTGLLTADDWPGPGEAFGASRSFVPSFRPLGADGQKFVGQVEQFQQGCVYDPTLVEPFTPDGLCAKCLAPTPTINPALDQQIFQLNTAFPYGVLGASADTLVIFGVLFDPSVGDPGNAYLNGVPMTIIDTLSTLTFGMLRVYVGDSGPSVPVIDMDNDFVFPFTCFWSFTGVSASNLAGSAGLVGSVDPVVGPSVNVPGPSSAVQLMVSLIVAGGAFPGPWYASPAFPWEFEAFNGAITSFYTGAIATFPQTFTPTMVANPTAVGEWASESLVFA